MSDGLAQVWQALEGWDRERPRTLTLPHARAQLYLGAMEIPLIAVRPRRPVAPREDAMTALVAVLGRWGLELECVQAGENYKLNRRDTKAYVGRIQPDALKLHAERILALGYPVFDEIVTWYLALPAR